MSYERRCFFDVPGEAQLLGQDVGGAGGQEGQRYLASGQTVNHFVQGAVATTGQHQLAAVWDRLAREIGGAAGASPGPSVSESRVSI